LEKRLPLALAICLLIVVATTFLFAPKPAPPAPTTAPPDAAAPPAASGSAAESTPSAPPASPASPANGAAATSGGAADTAQAPAPAASTAAPPTEGPVVVGENEPDLALEFGGGGERGHYRAVFKNRGGTLVSLRTGEWYDRVGLTTAEKADPEHWTELLGPVDTAQGQTASMALGTSPSSERLAREPLENALWARRVLGDPTKPDGVEFTLGPGTGVTFKKRFLFTPGADVFRFEFEIRNDTLKEPGPREFILVPAACVPIESGDRFYAEPQVIAFARKGSDASGSAEVKAVKDKSQVTFGDFSLPGPVSFVGVINKYFAVLLHGGSTDAEAQATLVGASWRTLPPPADGGPVKQIVTNLRLRVFLPEPGQSRTYRYEVYAGPKQREILEAAWPDFAKVAQNDLGMFNGIASVLLAVLNFFERITGNWGVAIILLTISVRLLLFPVNRRSQTAMARYQAKMKRLQPRIDEIKKKYAKDASAQRQEQAKLMQEEGVFPPLGGCLPMFLQIPVFIGLFAALRTSFDLRQADFWLWIHDLAVPDRLLKLGLNLPIPLIGSVSLEYLNVLPLLMVVLWIWQQKGMPMPADEQAARMQKMMMWMPVMMGFFLYNYAAGLSLYMITQSGLGIIEQKVIKKVWPIDDTERPKKKSRFMARLMELQQQQLDQQKKRRASQRRS
jgi:YidC/Oxa1 family membrane protein insertase